jgi:hypothetical protein
VDGRVAQLVEQCPFKAWVAGSSPAALTSFQFLTGDGNRFRSTAIPQRSRKCPCAGFYVWSRSPQELPKNFPKVSQLNGRWALAGTAAASLYAPTPTTFPDPSIWVESHFSIREVATALGGEVVDKGANLQILQRAI